jgi:hypothetical protein
MAYLIQPLYSFQPHVEIHDGSDRILFSFRPPPPPCRTILSTVLSLILLQNIKTSQN